MRFPLVSFVFLIACVAASIAAAHEDVLPYGLGGKIVTGGHDDVLGTNNIFQRVFGYDFGEDPLDPYLIGDPGFNNGTFAIGLFPNDGLLPTNKTLGFNVLGNLQYWDGTGGVSFSAAPDGVDLGIRRGSTTVHVSGLGQSGTVPTIGSTSTSGRLHVHVESQLNFSDLTDPNPPNAPDGVYLVGLEMKLDSGLANSDPIYFVYNNGVDEETHDVAIDWVQNNLIVPEPSSWALMAIAGVMIAAVARRRKSRDRQNV